MSTPAQILTAIQDHLKNSAHLSYINDDCIFLGARESMPQFPCIVIEPLPNSNEITNDMNTYVDIRYFVAVIAYNKVMEPNKQIVGDDYVKGIADIENDLKKAISLDGTLGGVAIDTIIHTSDLDFQEWPVRSVALEVEIFFRQNRTTRT